MNKKNILWWLGLIVAILTTIITYSSCSVFAVTAGKSPSSSITTSTTTTTIVDSTKLIIK